MKIQDRASKELYHLDMTETEKQAALTNNSLVENLRLQIAPCMKSISLISADFPLTVAKRQNR